MFALVEMMKLMTALLSLYVDRRYLRPHRPTRQSRLRYCQARADRLQHLIGCLKREWFGLTTAGNSSWMIAVAAWNQCGKSRRCRSMFVAAEQDYGWRMMMKMSMTRMMMMTKTMFVLMSGCSLGSLR